MGCVGGLPDACVSERSGIMCVACPANHFNSGVGCTKCAGQIVLLICGIVLAFGFVGVVYRTESMTSQVTIKIYCVFFVSCAVNLLQLFGLFQTMTIEMGEDSKFVSFSTVFVLEPQTLKLECLASKPLGEFFVAALFYPALALLCFAFAWISSFLLRRSVSPARIANAVLTINRSVLIAMANMSFSAFQCFEHPNGKRTLFQFPTVLCGEGDYNGFVAVSVFMVCTHLLPYNVLFVWAIFSIHRSRFDFVTTQHKLTQFKLFFQNWRAECWWWGYWFTLRQQLFSFSLVLAGKDAYVLTLWLTSLLLIHVVGLSVCTPWLAYEMNVIEIFSCSVIVCILSASIVNAAPSESVNSLHKACFVLLMVLFIFFLCFLVRILVEFQKNKFVPKAVFVSYPKPLKADELEMYLSGFCFPSFDKSTRMQIISNLSESSRRACDEFVRCMSTAGLCLMFKNDIIIKDRICVPGPALHGEGEFEKFKSTLENKKPDATESYI